MRMTQLAAFATILTAISAAWADPCGMVPPVYVGDDVPIARVGDQKTYVFFKDGIETLVIHPGFRGKVEEFGMLIPFPAVPALRKVPDNIFPHIAAAVDPPEVVVHVARFFGGFGGGGGLGGAAPGAAAPAMMQLEENEVRVVKEEAVGMYEVAVIEAGSAKALNLWMDDHGYKYPNGMDQACNDYIQDRWCFVAVKTKVGKKGNVNPKPGMRKVNTNLPTGSTFDGHVQAMGFRFRTEKPVVPMRLSTFNAGDLHNVVYMLTDEPQKIRSVPEEYVVRQIPGERLFGNVTNPLPLRIVGGTEKDLQDFQKKNLPKQRDPRPKNGSARDLFASDLKAVAADQLSHPHEEKEKMLLRIGEKLDLRGPDADRLNEDALAELRESSVGKSLGDLKSMTLTIIDGNFPREVLSTRNLAFTSYVMPHRRNSQEHYDANTGEPPKSKPGPGGVGGAGFFSVPVGAKQPARPLLKWSLAFAVCCSMGGLVWWTRRS